MMSERRTTSATGFEIENDLCDGDDEDERGESELGFVSGLWIGLYVRMTTLFWTHKIQYIIKIQYANIGDCLSI